MYDYILFNLQSAVEAAIQKRILELTHAAAPPLFIIEIRLPYRKWVRSAEVAAVEVIKLISP